MKMLLQCRLLMVLKFKNMAEGTSLEPITARIDRPAHGLQVSPTTVTGQLVEVPSIGMNSEPVFVVIGDDGVVTQVQTLIDLSFYLNNNVHVGGILLGHDVSPELGSIDLGFEDFSSQKLEKVFATEISFTPLQ